MAAASSSKATPIRSRCWVVADFLGVPEEDHEWFREGFDAPEPVGSLDGDTYDAAHVSFLEESSTKYVEDRRREPR